MKDVVKSSKVYVGLALWASFWVVALFVPRQYMFYVTNSLAFSVAIGILIAYAPGIKDALVRRDVSGGHWLILGIAVTWLATAFRQLWSWTWRLFDEPSWMANGLALAFITWMIVTGGALHLISQDAIGGQIPKRNWLRLGVWVTIGLVVGFTIVMLFGMDWQVSVRRPLQISEVDGT